MSQFCEFVVDALRGWRPVTARRMFGGHGIYHEGLMFALIAGEQLYLKVDTQSRTEFVAAGLPAFVYASRGRPVALTYHRAPDAMLDDPEVARQWAERAWQAALRAHLLKQARQSARPSQKNRQASRIRKA